MIRGPELLTGGPRPVEPTPFITWGQTYREAVNVSAAIKGLKATTPPEEIAQTHGGIGKVIFELAGVREQLVSELKSHHAG